MASTLVQALDFCSAGVVGFTVGPVAAARVGISQLAVRLGINLIDRGHRLRDNNRVLAKVAGIAALVFCVAGSCVFVGTCIAYPWTFTVAVSTDCLMHIFKVKDRVSDIAKKIFTNPNVVNSQETYFDEDTPNTGIISQKPSQWKEELQKIHFEEDMHKKETILQEFFRLKQQIHKSNKFLIELEFDKRHYQAKQLRKIPNPPFKFSYKERQKEILRLFDATKIQIFHDDGYERSRASVRNEIIKQLWRNNDNNNLIVDWLIDFFKKNPDQADDFIKELGAAVFHCSARINTLLSDLYIVYVQPDQFGTASALQICARLYMFLDGLRKGILDHAATFQDDSHRAATHAWVRRNIGPEFGVWNVLEDTHWDSYSYVKRGSNDDMVRVKFMSCYTPSVILERLQEELDKGSGSQFSFTHLQKWFNARHIEPAEFTEEIEDKDGNLHYRVKKEALLYFLMATHVVRPDSNASRIYT